VAEAAARADGLHAAQSPQYGEGDDQLARMRSSARAGGMAAGLMGWPIAAWSTTGAASGAGAFFIAAAVGGAVAIAAGLLFIRARDRSTAAPLLQALAASTAGWWRTDATGLITSVHPGRLTAAMDIGQMRGRVLWQPDPDVAALDPIQEAFVARRAFHQVAVRRNGAERPLLLLSGGPVFGTAGELVGFAGTAMPAADAGAAAGGQASSMRADLDERSRQLGERTRELDNAVRELDSFAYSVSHDLRAPLRVVDGFATIVLEDYGDRGKPLDDVGRDHLRRIVAASQRMNTMIDTLLGLSRMTSRELTRERVDLSQVARELTEDLRAPSSFFQRWTARAAEAPTFFVLPKKVGKERRACEGGRLTPTALCCSPWGAPQNSLRSLTRPSLRQAAASQCTCALRAPPPGLRCSPPSKAMDSVAG
jgi:signal transduction histidine kinase